jgi:lactoylglutathione lyase
MAAATPERQSDLRVRLEVFPEDLDAFVDFYTRVLGFRLERDQRAGEWPYAAVERGGVRIGAARPWQAVDASARAVPTGVEVVLEVDDVQAERDAVVAAGWPLAEDLRERPWGLTDFRVLDPGGYYLRITAREER